MSEDLIEGRITKGMELLDRLVPDWRANVVSVDVTNYSNCVLCQATGRKSFFAACQQVGLTIDGAAREHGFQTNKVDLDRYSPAAVLLNAAWSRRLGVPLTEGAQQGARDAGGPREVEQVH